MTPTTIICAVITVINIIVILTYGRFAILDIKTQGKRREIERLTREGEQLKERLAEEEKQQKERLAEEEKQQKDQLAREERAQRMDLIEEFERGERCLKSIERKIKAGEEEISKIEERKKELIKAEVEAGDRLREIETKIEVREAKLSKEAGKEDLSPEEAKASERLRAIERQIEAREAELSALEGSVRRRNLLKRLQGQRKSGKRV